MTLTLGFILIIVGITLAFINVATIRYKPPMLTFCLHLTFGFVYVSGILMIIYVLITGLARYYGIAV